MGRCSGFATLSEPATNDQRWRRPYQLGLTGAMTARATANSYSPRWLAPAPGRLRCTNSDVDRPERRTVWDQRRAVVTVADTVAKPLDGARRTWTNPGISAQPADRNGRSWTTCPLLRIRCSGACCAPDRAVMMADANPQAGRRICARICARDAAGHVETGETQKAWDDFTPQVCRGQRGDRRLSETGETHVVRLITQRSRVQIPPPLPICRSEASSRTEKGPSACGL